MQTRTDWPTLIVGGIFFLLGVIFGGVAIYVWSPGGERQLASEGRPARAEVLRKSIHADRASGSIVRPAFRIDYRFVPEQGSAVAASAAIDAGLWRRLSPGDAVELVYLASDPTLHRVESQQRDLMLPVVFGLVALIFAPLGAWLMRNGLRPGEVVRVGLAARFVAWVARSPAFALGIIGVLFFLPFAGGGVYWLAAVRSEQALFEARAQSVEGTVLSKAIVKKSSGGSSSGPGRRHHQSTHYQVTYRFMADSGDEIVGTSELDTGDWERLKERAPIRVVYVGGSPWLHRVEGGGASWTGPIIFLVLGGLGMLASAGLAAWGRRRGKSARSMPKRTPPRRAQAPAPQASVPGKTHASWLVVAIGAIFFFAGCGAFIGGVGDFMAERRFSSEGLVAEALVVDKKIEEAQRSGRTRTQYVALYRFQTSDGKPAQGRAVLEVSAWESAKPGDRLGVRYLPAEPQINRAATEGGVAGTIIIMIIGPLFALIGAALVWYSFPPRRRAA